jgi:hypothetical protein
MTDVKEAQVAVPVINDSSAGLAQLYVDLNPLALKVRRNASFVLFYGLMLMCTAEGMFSLIAAAGVLCCAAPGSLGTAYAARFTRIMASIAAGISLAHILFLSSFAIVVMPHMPQAIERVCGPSPPDHPAFNAGPMSIALHAVTSQEAAADTVAFGISSASRKLQEVVNSASPPVPCEQMGRFVGHAAHPFLMVVFFLQCGLFASTLCLSKSSGALVRKARECGANAI